MARDQFGHELDEQGNPLIAWSPGKLAEFRQMYADATAAGAESFRFEGIEVLPAYAKHLIDYLEGLYGKARPDDGQCG